MQSGSDASPTDADHNLLANSRFDDGISLPWSTSFTAPGDGDAEVDDGAYCVKVTQAGKNRWDAQFRHREMVIQRGHKYRVSFRAWSDKPTQVRPKLGMAGPPYAEYWASTIKLGPKPETFNAAFVMTQPDDPTAELAFHAGAELAAAAPFKVCIDDIVLEDPSFVRAQVKQGATVAKLQVNQLGYLPDLEKRATLASDATEPLAWELVDATGAKVAEGKTQAFGADKASGQVLHIADFSTFTTPGTGYKLKVGAAESHSFDIRPDVYAKLRSDALWFFYHQRSGVEIKLPYAGEAKWARPAGHLSDKSVKCDSGCDYTLDVSGGWYDAGDHGKYVVNAGITVWTLLELYERAQRTGTLAAVGDNTLRLPEAGNGVSDLLDEARWELEWLLKMQVPTGKPLAGMVHHKIHDKAWTEIGVAPHEDKQPRVLKAPSTAATLNLAAAAAQGARVYRSVDAAFSKRLLDAAQRAYAAAVAHPAVYAPASDAIGGGPYDDKDVRDEFFWAAAELLVTTGDAKYREALRSWSGPIVPTSLGEAAGDAGQLTSLTWQNLVTAGAIDLAFGPESLGEDRTRARSELTKAADAFVATREREGYGLPYAAAAYPWGSNSFVLNNAVVLALAYDVSKDRKYLNAVSGAMDYLLGNNPLDQSYVTGYGARPLRNPHHRFFAHQARADRPEPPPGLVSGGPNSGLQDPVARGAGLQGKPPQRCFIDDIGAYSVNEVAINWNAPLAFVSAFLDDSQASH